METETESDSHGLVDIGYRSGSEPGRPPDVQVIQKQMAIVAWQPGPNRVLLVPSEVCEGAPPGVMALLVLGWDRGAHVFMTPAPPHPADRAAAAAAGGNGGAHPRAAQPAVTKRAAAGPVRGDVRVAGAQRGRGAAVPGPARRLGMGAGCGGAASQQPEGV
jgi:hypothetical protein